MRKEKKAAPLISLGLAVSLLLSSCSGSSSGQDQGQGSLDSSASDSATPPAVDTGGLRSPEKIEMLYTDEEVRACAKLIYGEYGADWVSDSEKAKVVCTLVNRTKSTRWINYVGSSSLMAQLTYPGQFHYYESFPVTERHYRVAYDVLWRASQIEQGCEGITWETYALNYWGDGQVNHFY